MYWHRTWHSSYTLSDIDGRHPIAPGTAQVQGRNLLSHIHSRLYLLRLVAHSFLETTSTASCTAIGQPFRVAVVNQKINVQPWFSNRSVWPASICGWACRWSASLSDGIWIGPKPNGWSVSGTAVRCTDDSWRPVRNRRGRKKWQREEFSHRKYTKQMK